MSGQVLAPPAVFGDDRGRIVALPGFPAAGVMVIESRAGAVRGNHYHRHESHLMYVVSGQMIYVEHDGERQRTVVVRAGQAVVTGPAVVHTTYFPVDTVLVVLSDVDRTGDRYEQEIVRVAPLLAGTGLTPGPTPDPVVAPAESPPVPPAGA